MERIASTPDATDGQADATVEQPRPRTAWNQWRLPPDPDVHQYLERQLYFEGEGRAAGLSRFFTLLVLAVLIATLGLYANSSAIVIAAMLVAPLMIPIVGLSLALVSGQPSRQLNSVIVVIAAVAVAVLLSYVIGQSLPNLGTLQSEVLARTRPNLIDLGIALVAGAAGSYSLVRFESGALAGVAIGVSLVPPLCAVGLLIADGEPMLAEGAMLLFITNLAAIVFASSVVFSLTGFLPVSEIGQLPRSVRIGIAMALLAVLIVAIPLYRVSSAIIATSREQSEIQQVVDDWLEQTDYELFEMQHVGDELRITVLASAESRLGLDALEAELEAVTGEHLAPVLRIIQYQLVEPQADQP